MKIRRSTGAGQDKVELQMTPMIDIVFQLLVFFIMTFKVIVQEGDFNVKMPLGAAQPGALDENLVPPMRLQLRSNSAGDLTSITLNEQSFTRFEDLNRHMIGFIGTDRGPGSIQSTAEVEIDADYNLRYEETVKALTAVSGYKDESGHVITLVEKIKFTEPKPP